MRSIFLVLVMLILPAASATSGGDAGSGTDAGDTVGTALPVALGSFEGSVSYPGDHSDVFRFDLPDRSGVRLIVTPLTGTLFLYTYHDAGHIQSGSSASSAPIEIRSVAYGGTVHLGVHATTTNVAYRVDATAMPRDDIAIVALDVTPRDAAGLQRDIRVVLENQGAGYNGWSDESLRVRAIHTDGAVRHVGTIAWGSSLQMAPGASREFTMTWDTFGEVGDVQLVVEAIHARDEDPSDNVRVIEQSVLREGAGTDLLNQDLYLEAAGAHAFARWNSAPWMVPIVPYVGGNAHAGTDAAYCRTEPSIGFACGFPGAEPVFWAVVDALP